MVLLVFPSGIRYGTHYMGLGSTLFNRYPVWRVHKVYIKASDAAFLAVAEPLTSPNKIVCAPLTELDANGVDTLTTALTTEPACK